jgi:hypothetical protein
LLRRLESTPPATLRWFHNALDSPTHSKLDLSPELDAIFLIRSKSSHTAHNSTSAKVYYRHHPLFGTEVEIIKHKWNCSVDCVMVVVADETRCLIPRWMLDESLCAGLHDESLPRISIDALVALRQLLDAQSFPSNDSSATLSASAHQRKGETNAAHKTAKSKTAGDSLGRRSSSVEANAPSSTRSMSGATNATTAHGRRSRSQSQRKGGKQ